MARVSLDFREYLSVLESLNDVEHIDRPVNAWLEAAAIARRSTGRRRRAPLFNNVEGAKA
jgi:UbiD family decarboxylase